MLSPSKSMVLAITRPTFPGLGAGRSFESHRLHRSQRASRSTGKQPGRLPCVPDSALNLESMRVLLKEQLQPIKEDLATVKDGLASVKEGLATVEEGLATVKQRVDGMDRHMGSLLEYQAGAEAGNMLGTDYVRSLLAQSP